MPRRWRAPTQMLPTWLQRDQFGRQAALHPRSGFVVRDTRAGEGVRCRPRAGWITSCRPGVTGISVLPARKEEEEEEEEEEEV
jgi:hypothetical protein